MPTVDKAHPEAGFVEVEPLAIAAIDFVWVIIALACCLLAFAGWVIFSVLDDIFGGISIFGYHPFGVIAGLLQAAMKKAWGWAENRLGAFTNWLWSQISVIWRFMYVAVVSIVGLWDQVLFNDRYQTNSLSSEAQRAQAAESNLQTQLNQEEAALSKDLGALGGEIATLQYETIPAIESELTILEGEIANLSAPDLSAIEAELKTDVASLTREIQSVEGTLNQTIAGDVTSLQNQIGSVTTTLEQQITNGVSNAEQFATNLAPSIQAGAVATVLAQLAPQLQKIETDITECLDPLCDTVTPNAQRAGRNLNWLKNLEALGFEAALFALAAECLTDPQAVVNDITTVMEDIGNPIMDAGKALIGLV